MASLLFHMLQNFNVENNSQLVEKPPGNITESSGCSVPVQQFIDINGNLAMGFNKKKLEKLEERQEPTQQGSVMQVHRAQWQ